MGLKKFSLEILDNTALSFFPGQVIRGILHVHNNKDYKHAGITVSLEGKAMVRWMENVRVSKEERKETKKSRRTRTEINSAEEKYFDIDIDVLGTGNSQQILLPGHHQFPFDYSLPPGLPSSFVGKSGMVSYEIRAEIKSCPGKKEKSKRSKRKDNEARVPFTVNGILDLNREPGAAQPMEVRKYKKLCCLFCKSSPIGFVLTLPRKGFVSGEYLQFTAELSNQSKRRVRGVRVYLAQKTTYNANGKSIFHTKTICEAKGPAVEPGDSESWSGNILKIPPLPPTRLANCRIIDVEYSLKFEMDLAGPAINLRQEIPIIIGSIPFESTYETLRRQNASPPLPSSPSAPAEDQAGEAVAVVVSYPDRSSFLQHNYPDLPPPSYAEATLHDPFNGGNGESSGGDNFAYDGSPEKHAAGMSTFSRATAPPQEDVYYDYVPKYVTYA